MLIRVHKPDDQIVVNDMKKKKIVELIHYVISLLTEGKYKKVYDLDCRKLLSIEEIKDGVENSDSGLILTLQPLKELKGVEIYDVEGGNEVYVDVELWYGGEASDTTLSISIINNGKDIYDFSIENIHIL